MTDTLAPPPVPPLTNRHASPARSPSNHRSHPDVQQKEQRVQQQLQRHCEERGRKMEEQRRKETQRRAAAGERRRQQQEADKERLEALVRRRTGNAERRGGAAAAGEARDQPENRPKRWTWGGPPDGAEGPPPTPPSCHAIGSSQPNEPPAARASQSCHVVDFLVPPTIDQPISKQLSNSSAALHSADRASSRTNRSSSNRRSVAGLPEEGSRARAATLESPNTPVRSSSFRANSKGPATPKRVRSSKNRAQSPCSPGQYPSSPLRHRATTPGSDEVKGHGTLERKATKSETEKKIPKSTSRELTAESPGTPTGRSVAGTTDAEEASRLLAERRRVARVQKEQEEKQRQEDERLRAEEERRRQLEAAEEQLRAERHAEEERGRREEERRSREEEERRAKEQRWKDMQDELDREREEAFLRAQKEAERKRKEREQLHVQEEQERQQRKKRIEEIMKRTRKSEVEPPTAASGSELPPPPSEEDSDITLGPLETKSCVDELSDGVQSMDVSPVSRDEHPSAHEFSPVSEGLDQLMDLDYAGPGPGPGPGPGLSPAYPRLQAGSAVGDLNKNLLIHGYSAKDPAPLIHSVGPSKIHLQ